MYTKLQPISVETLMNGIGKLTYLVEEKIKQILPEKFALIFDGWSDSSIHYLAVFAVFSDSKETCGFQKILLSFSPLIHDEDLSAASHHQTVYEILKTFGKDFSNLACVIGDNCAVNQSFARQSNCYSVGCSSHRLNLGVQKFLNDYSQLIESVREVIISLRTIKNRAALQKKTRLVPVLDNATRWSSKFEMLKRYTLLQEHIEDIVPVELQLSPVDNASVLSLLKKLDQLEVD
jgi:hypothetical protein